jgi:hypothetical protein
LPHGKNRFHLPDGDSYLTAISIFLCLTARIGFIRLTAIHASRRYQFSLRLTGIINFSLPLGKNRFYSALWQFTPHGDYQFFFASRQESISFRLMAIHASQR